MKLKAKTSKTVLKVAEFMAKRASASASMFGFYQPKEPKMPNKKK